MKKSRNYGIDLLRIFSMFLIVILHTLGHGGILGSVEIHSGKYWGLWLTEISAYCAVDCFALISGYVMWKSSFKLEKISELWMQVLFYSVVLTGFVFYINPAVRSTDNVLTAIFPITRGQWWYLSSYFGMYLLGPVMNSAICNLSRSSLKKVLLGVFVMMSVLPTVLTPYDPYTLGAGLSTIWLCILYLFGAYIGKYQIGLNLSCVKLGAFSISMILFTFGFKMIVEMKLGGNFANIGDGNMLVNYTSPTILLTAISLVILSSKLKLGDHAVRFIKLVSPLTLGVYMIHDHPLIRNEFMAGSSVRFLESNAFVMEFKVLVFAGAVFVLCLVIEFGRSKLFRILRVRGLCRRAVNCIERKF